MEALNELLRVGKAGGGMGTGVAWEPFTVTKTQYDAVTELWRDFDLRSVLKFPESVMPDLTFVFDGDFRGLGFEYSRSAWRVSGGTHHGG